MCGIIGYVGPRACKPLLLDGLERLEYRGYDSAGIVLREDDGFDPEANLVIRISRKLLGSRVSREGHGQQFFARENGWQDTNEEGHRVDRTLGFAHLGGATLDNEENYVIKKAFTAMGAVQIENQARI